jgi:hypothetical protein
MFLHLYNPMSQVRIEKLKDRLILHPALAPVDPYNQMSEYSVTRTPAEVVRGSDRGVISAEDAQVAFE